ncbi:MAG TPA: hypothetical protein GXX40_01835 [Firmicutes bacterium]|nr:hypothetical protein [Bacillota bacterium]
MIGLVVLAFLCLFLETVLTIPDIAFALCTAVALKKGALGGALLGGLCGALVDLAMGKFVGSNAFPMIATSLGVGWLARDYLRPSEAVGMVCGLLAGLMNYSLKFLLLRTSGVNLIPGVAMQKIMIGALWAALLVPVWVYVLSRREKRVGRVWVD